MTKLAPLIGRDITERVFLPRFAQMCGDALFHVRKVRLYTDVKVDMFHIHMV